MRIAVIGAGIVGVTTAYELDLDGHDVTVFEQRSAVAEEASFANAGIISPGCVSPLGAPGSVTQTLFRWLGQHPSVSLTQPLGRRELQWAWQAVQASKAETWLTNRQHMQRLAFYSRECLDRVVESLSMELDASQGYLVLLCNETAQQSAQIALQALRDRGAVVSLVDADQARVIEPALSTNTALCGALHFAHDGVANCRQFALLLKRQAQLLGVNFEFNTVIAHINPARSATISIAISDSSRTLERSFDRVVICAGNHSATLLRPLGLALPLEAVYGYAVSATINEPLNAPRSAVLDERHNITISRLGNRVRVAGGFELGGLLDIKRTATLQRLYGVLQDWFPGAANMAVGHARVGTQLGAGVQEWKGACATTPAGPPLIGDSGIPGVWLNAGHGRHGWAMSCGSARSLADLMAGRTPQIDMTGLGIERL